MHTDTHVHALSLSLPLLMYLYAEESELLRLATRLSRALFEELQAGRIES